MSRLDGKKFVEIVPEPEPCRVCGKDMNKVGYVVYCGCVIDDEGNTQDDCGACSDGFICVECDAWAKQVERGIT